MRWVCKHDLLGGASCERGDEVRWKAGSRLSGSAVRAAAVCWWQGSLPRAAVPVWSPEQMGSPVPFISRSMPLPKQHEWNIYFISWGWLFICLPHPHLEWLWNLCWACVTTRSHGSVFILHWFVTGLEKALATSFWESTKKTNITQGFPLNRG